MVQRTPISNFKRSTLMVFVAVAAIGGAFYLTSAGSIDPTVAPVGTFYDLSTVYDAIASTTYDSSSLTGNPNGSAFQVTKCIITRMTGGSCP